MTRFSRKKRYETFAEFWSNNAFQFLRTHQVVSKNNPWQLVVGRGCVRRQITPPRPLMLTSNRNAERANILVVDDNRDAADTMALFLKLSGHNLQIAVDGYQAIEIARRQPPNYARRKHDGDE
jgi:hypothetical protein